MTGARVGLILQTTGTTITALIIAFTAGWKLTLVILCITPLIILSGKVQSLQNTTNNKTNLNKKSANLSFVEQGSQVCRIIQLFFFRYLTPFDFLQYASQALEHIRTVVALHQEQYFLLMYKKSFDGEFK